MKKYILLVFVLFLLINCSKEDTENFDSSKSAISFVYHSKFKYSVYEYPYILNGDTIGRAEMIYWGLGNPNLNDVTYSIKAENPFGALAVDSNTGYITVKNASLLDASKLSSLTFSIQGKSNDFDKAVIGNKDVLPLCGKGCLITLDETPIKIFGNSVKNGDVLDTLVGGSYMFEEKITYFLKEATPAGAIEIDSVTGIVSVKDETLFDAQLYDKISYTVELKLEHEASNKSWVIPFDLDIYLIILSEELCGFYAQPFLFYFENYTVSFLLKPNTEDIELEAKSDVHFTTEEYTFVPTKDLQLCNAYIQLVNSTTEQTGTFELLNEQGENLIEPLIGFNCEPSWGCWDSFYFYLPYVLESNKTYTIRITMNKANTGINQYYLTNKDGSDFQFPIHYEDVTITSAKFFDGANEVNVSGFPMINLSFVK